MQVSTAATGGKFSKVSTRILRRFKRDLSNAGIALDLPQIDANDPDLKQKRLNSGGIYTWQPERNDRWPMTVEAARTEIDFLEHDKPKAGWAGFIRKFPNRCLLFFWPGVWLLLPILMVGCGVITGISMSCDVPPKGWKWYCRPGGELLFLVGWVASYFSPVAVSWLQRITILQPGRIFTMSSLRYMLCKDLIATCLSISWIFATQSGIFNRCDCYTRKDKAGLALPQQPNTKRNLWEGLRFNGTYTTILELGIGAQALIILVLFCRYYSACRVFLQTDDGSSNIAWLHRICDGTKKFMGARYRRIVEFKGASTSGAGEPTGFQPHRNSSVTSASPSEDGLEMSGVPKRSLSSLNNSSVEEARPLIRRGRDENHQHSHSRDPSNGASSAGSSMSDTGLQTGLPLNTTGDGNFPRAYRPERSRTRSGDGGHVGYDGNQNTFLSPRQGYRRTSSNESRADRVAGTDDSFV